MVKPGPVSPAFRMGRRRAVLPGDAAAGHGLDALRARLQVLYGEDACLDVEGADGGKVVSLSLPLGRSS